MCLVSCPSSDLISLDENVTSKRGDADGKETIRYGRPGENQVIGCLAVSGTSYSISNSYRNAEPQFHLAKLLKLR